MSSLIITKQYLARHMTIRSQLILEIQRKMSLKATVAYKVWNLLNDVNFATPLTYYYEYNKSMLLKY